MEKIIIKITKKERLSIISVSPSLKIQHRAEGKSPIRPAASDHSGQLSESYVFSGTAAARSKLSRNWMRSCLRNPQALCSYRHGQPWPVLIFLY